MGFGTAPFLLEKGGVGSSSRPRLKQNPTCKITIFNEYTIATAEAAYCKETVYNGLTV
jgi:hypothetical protein